MAGPNTRPASGLPGIDYLSSATAHLDPPLLAVDTAAMHANVADLRRRAAGTPIRLASTSIRVRSVIDNLLADNSGAFHAVMASSVREASWLARSGITDVLVGYPSTERDALSVVLADRVLSGRITLMVDSVAHLGVRHVDMPATSMRVWRAIQDAKKGSTN